ncbi:hypothetical protein PQR34_32190 [Paraburkholderia sediminicola]|uniref:hypothetical protein n=1 Tax=Paraburkholderia sediminicola TaxID=458836 RepID=UPI0038B6EA1F
MYTLTTPISQFTLQTLIEVFQLFQTEPTLQTVATADVQLSRDSVPATVTRFNGALTIRHTQSASDFAAALVDEVAIAWFDRGSGIAAPWQVRPQHWESFQALFDLGKDVRLLFSSSQIEAEKTAAKAHGEYFQFSNCVHRAAMERLGFGFNGSLEPISRQMNGRHAVHVAYALVANRPVPESVIADYRAMEEPFKYDLEWARPLLDLPELRGALPPRKWAALAQVLRHAKITLSSETAPAYIAAMEALPADVDPLAVDNRLYELGLLQALPLPERFMSPLDVGTPVSELAARLRELVADNRRSEDLNRAEDEFAKGRISKRLYQLQRQMALLDRGRSTYEWPNRFATGLAERNGEYLLSVLDTADDWNKLSKQVVREMLGVKIRGLKPSHRRRAIFSLCGFDEAQQAKWEQQAVATQAQKDREREAKEAREQAQSVKFRVEDGSVLNGAEFVDQAIADGFSEIRSERKGASRVYLLVNPARGLARKLKATDGTLAYARAVLDVRLAA